MGLFVFQPNVHVPRGKLKIALGYSSLAGVERDLGNVNSDFGRYVNVGEHSVC